MFHRPGLIPFKRFDKVGTLGHLLVTVSCNPMMSSVDGEDGCKVVGEVDHVYAGTPIKGSSVQAII